MPRAALSSRGLVKDEIIEGVENLILQGLVGCAIRNHTAKSPRSVLNECLVAFPETRAFPGIERNPRQSTNPMGGNKSEKGGLLPCFC